ncbi:MAG: LysM peptidoglycan-binding domain-containing protein [Patescibacteria group bacterium]|nr:LysM peptidoglycan-binding domain-containing protein [Patescibacteria group bacterium]
MNTFENETSKLKRFLKAIRLNESLISTILGGMVVVIVGILIYNYFSGVNKSVKPVEIISDGITLVQEDGKLVPSDLPITHTVTKGEYLWSIAEKYYESGYNWVDIARENNLSNANIVTEGQKLIIPRVGVIALEKAGDKTPKISQPTSYTVQAGDTLWQIAVKVYADGYKWTEIWQTNQDIIPNSNLIEVGMELSLPR